MTQQTKVFVYGSLRQGYGNHRLLEGSTFLGQRTTQPLFTMVNLGAFPAVLPDGDTPIVGELYEVDADTFDRLDWLEGYPNFYDRMLVDIEGDTAWMYYIAGESRGSIVPSGDWNART